MSLMLLLVENEAALRERWRQLLAKDGHVVFVASTCDEAIDLMSRHFFNAAIIDWNLSPFAPELTPRGCRGTDLVHRVPRGTAIYMVSGYPLDQVNPFERIEMTLTKPVDWPLMRHLLARLEERVKPQDERTPPSGTKV